jgi:hypothetical protein
VISRLRLERRSSCGKLKALEDLVGDVGLFDVE